MASRPIPGPRFDTACPETRAAPAAGRTREPSALYNAMIHPLARFPIRGVLWYQGESKTSDPGVYRKLFPAMISAWRAAWNQGEFPFLSTSTSSGFLGAVTISPGRAAGPNCARLSPMALDTPGTAMAVAADLGDEHQMHPADKQDVAHRLALIALSQTYGKSGLTASGPRFSGMRVEDGKARLSFTHAAAASLPGAAPRSRDSKSRARIGRSSWADARIDDDQVIVQSPQVPKPAAVRYAWADFPECTLFNKAGLPAAPFRTDAWVPGEQGSPGAVLRNIPVAGKARETPRCGGQ